MNEKTKHRFRFPRFLRQEQFKILLPCLARFGSAFLFTAASLRGEYLPLGLCFLAVSGSGFFGFSALCGVVFSALLFWTGSAAAELCSIAVLIFSAQLIFRGTEAAENPYFMPTVVALMTALIGGVLLLAGGLQNSALSFWFLRILFCFAGTWLLDRAVKNPSQNALLLLTGCLILSASCLSLGSFSVGVLLAALVTASTAGNPAGLAFAAACGIALDYGSALPLSMTAILCLASLFAGMALRHSRILSALLAAAILFGGTALAGADSAPIFWSALPGVALSCLLPAGLFQPAKPAPKRPKPAVLHMEEATLLLSDLSERLHEGLPALPQAKPALIFDRAADRVCKSCVLFSTCWSGPCEAYDALSGAAPAMLQRGAVLQDDFPVSFLSRCRHIESLLPAINQELDGVLYRRQFRHRLVESRALLADQYRIFAAYLQNAVSALSDEERLRPVCSPVIGVGTKEKRGSAISGDRGASFRTASHLHYILLCDGMGSGEDAREESTACVRLLRGLLSAGFSPENALQLLNSVYLLRDDGAFSTVDLLQIDLAAGDLRLWKWGSAPSYLKRGNQVQKIGTALPPPGLEGTGRAEQFELSLGEGEMLILLSDGAERPETEERIRSFGGRSPKELATGILKDGEEGEDDRTAVVLKLQPVASYRQPTTNCG
ncbi:MAG: SpoIIE family protein phosphatase [Oscillospiraceae bacterium]|nr:SpoIIE family protein phosphatase [Oscillospiraceae bacterium]